MRTELLCWFCRQPAGAFVIAPNHRRMCFPCHRKGCSWWKRLRWLLWRASSIFKPRGGARRVRSAS